MSLLLSRPSALGWLLCFAVTGALSPHRGAEPAQVALTEVPNYREWKHGPSTNQHFFPIAVWLQSPRNAARFQRAGINLYVGLWRGPTTNQLAELAAAGMPVICAQNKVGLANRDNPIIVGWMHGDEPDNAQAIPGQRGYGPPIAPEQVVRDYARLKTADPARPVLLNLGQGVAWDNYIGRGVRRNHPEDYPLYVQGCDIASFDIYPVVHENAEIAGKLEYVAKGVERLVQWAGPGRPVWNCIECTHISNPRRKATPAQVKAEVWMALIQRSRGLIYFVHQFEPEFKEAALLDDPVLLEAITAINRQVSDLAPVLNQPTRPSGATTFTELLAPGQDRAQPRAVRWMEKWFEGSRYLFAVNLRNDTVRVRLDLGASLPPSAIEVLGEDRPLSAENGALTDEFTGYQVHLYKFPRTP